VGDGRGLSSRTAAPTAAKDLATVLPQNRNTICRRHYLGRMRPAPLVFLSLAHFTTGARRDERPNIGQIRINRSSNRGDRPALDPSGPHLGRGIAKANPWCVRSASIPSSTQRSRGARPELHSDLHTPFFPFSLTLEQNFLLQELPRPHTRTGLAEFVK